MRACNHSSQNGVLKIHYLLQCWMVSYKSTICCNAEW